MKKTDLDREIEEFIAYLKVALSPDDQEEVASLSSGALARLIYAVLNFVPEKARSRRAAK